MTKLTGFTISTMDKTKGIAVDTHFTNMEALVLCGLVVAGTAVIINGCARLGIAFVKKVKEKA